MAAHPPVIVHPPSPSGGRRVTVGKEILAQVAGEAEAVREAVRALEAISDPIERARETSDLLRRWPELHRLVREVRQHAVIAAHEQGRTFDEIGTEIDTSGYRASQISRGK